MVKEKIQRLLNEDFRLGGQQDELQAQIDELNKQMRKIKAERRRTMEQISMILGFNGVFAGEPSPKQLHYAIGLLNKEFKNVDRKRALSLTKLECHCVISVIKNRNEGKEDELRDEVIEYFDIIVEKLTI